MYVCTYVCAVNCVIVDPPAQDGCMHACMNVCMCLCMSALGRKMYVCMHACMHDWFLIFKGKYLFLLYSYDLYVCIHVFMLIYFFRHRTCMHARTRHTYACIRACDVLRLLLQTIVFVFVYSLCMYVRK